MSQGSNAHEQRATRCPVSRLVHSPGPPASVITWKISTRDPGITITGSQLTGMARLPYNRKVDFCCVKLRCRDLCEANQPGACNQAHSSIARFYTLLLTSPVFQSLRAHTQNFTSTLPPPTSSHPPSLYQMNFWPYHVLSIQILSKISEKEPQTESLTTFKISTMFWTIDKTFYNHHFISIHCNYTIPS